MVVVGQNSASFGMCMTHWWSTGQKKPGIENQEEVLHTSVTTLKENSLSISGYKEQEQSRPSL